MCEFKRLSQMTKNCWEEIVLFKIKTQKISICIDVALLV